MVIDEDMMYHLKIAEASQNKMLKSSMMIIIPDILTSYIEYKVCGNDRLKTRHERPKALFKAIAHKDPELGQIRRDHSEEILKLGTAT